MGGPDTASAGSIANIGEPDIQFRICGIKFIFTLRRNTKAYTAGVSATECV
jgi:hypothetical protein